MKQATSSLITMFCDWKSRWTKQRGSEASCAAISARRARGQLLFDVVGLESEVTHQAIFQEVVLFPAVKFGVEFRLQLGRFDRRGEVRPGAECCEHLVERAVVEVAPLRPCGSAR